MVGWLVVPASGTLRLAVASMRPAASPSRFPATPVLQLHCLRRASSPCMTPWQPNLDSQSPHATGRLSVLHEARRHGERPQTPLLPAACRAQPAPRSCVAPPAAPQEETGMWCFRDERGGRQEMEGPYTVAELRGLHMR